MKQLGAVAIGPQKTATTWLHAVLTGVAGYALPATVKETFFFDLRYDRGWDWYWTNFPETGNNRPMEVAPSYFVSTAARERLAAHNPECRIVVTLRHPVERAYSHYLHRRRKEGWDDSFEIVAGRDPTIVSSSHYRQHLPAWIEAFGRQRVLILLQEDIGTEPAEVFKRLCDFLGVVDAELPERLEERIYTRSLPRSPFLARNATKVSRWLRDRDLHRVVEALKFLGGGAVYRGGEGRIGELAPQARAELLDRYSADVAFVEELTGRSLEAWRC